VTLAVVTDVRETAEAAATDPVMTSPTSPAAALSAAVVPRSAILSAFCCCCGIPLTRTRGRRWAMAYSKIGSSRNISMSVVERARPTRVTSWPAVDGAVVVNSPAVAASKK
jgi:hypothetical protein